MAWEALTIETGWGGEQWLCEGGALSAAHSSAPVHTQLAEMKRFQLILLSSAVLTDETVRRELRSKGMWHRRGLSHCLCGAAETQQELWLLICSGHRWTIVSLMSYCIPESGVQSEKSNIHLLCQGIPPYHSYIYLFWKKNVCIRYYLLTSNTSSSDIGISVGIIRLKT